MIPGLYSWSGSMSRPNSSCAFPIQNVATNIAIAMNIELSAILFPGQNLCVMRQSYNAVVVSRETLTSGRNRKRAHKDQAPARLLGIVQASQILDPCRELDHAIFPYNLYKPPLTLDTYTVYAPAVRDYYRALRNSVPCISILLRTEMWDG